MRQEEDRRAATTRGGGSDPETLQALIEVFRHLDLAQQMRELATRAAAWTGLHAGLAYALDEDPRRLILVLGNDPDREIGPDAPKLEIAALEGALGPDGEVACDGLPGIFAQSEGLISEPPAVSWTLVVRDPNDATAGLLLLLGAAAPEEQARERVRDLLLEARAAIGNGVTVRATRELIFKDDTADCFNRRYFNEFLMEEMARATRFRAPLSLIFFDMDNLKEVNSRHGHAMGSRVLFEVSQRVRSRIRKFDKLFRFGGDEFCIVLPETEWHGALEVAERVRESLAVKALLMRETGKGVKMTASFGIASFPLHARDREGLIQRADRAMQRIKRGTKNSIAIAEIAKPEASR